MGSEGRRVSGLVPGKFLLAAGIAIILAVGLYLFMQLRARRNADTTAQTTTTEVTGGTGVTATDGAGAAAGSIQTQVGGQQVLIAPVVGQRKILSSEVQPTAAPATAAPTTAPVATQVEQIQTQSVDPTAVPIVNTPVPAIADPGSCSSGRAHTVAQGENVFRISNAYNVTQNDIRNMNSLDGYYTIYPGQRLCLPQNAAGAPNGSTQGAQLNVGNGNCAAGQHAHTVFNGSTLFAFALEHNTTLEQVAALNGLDQNAWLSVGQQLCMPN